MKTRGTDPAVLRNAFPHGVATARQLMATGIPERTVYRRCLDGGPWQLVLPGIVLLFTGRPTRDQAVRAALLLCGPDAVVTGLEACRRHGVRRGPAPRHDDVLAEVHVLVPHSRQVRSTGHVHVERTHRMPQPIVRRGVPLAPVARACLDAARRIADRGDVAELFSDAVQRRLCPVADLTTELAAASRRGTAVPRSVLQDVAEGTRSAAELRAARLWKGLDIPEPWRNATIYDGTGRRVGTADFWFDEVAMVWEIESTEWHLSPEQHDRDVARAADFAAAGAIYVASKPRVVVQRPDEVRRMLSKTYAQAAARPRPALRAIRATQTSGRPPS